MNRRFNFGKKKVEETPPTAPLSTTAPEVERAMLGALIANPDHIPNASEWLKPEAFYGAVHRQIYEEIISFGMKSDVFDLVTFTQHLADKQLLDSVGGPSYLTELLIEIQTPEHYTHYRGILETKLRVRNAWEQACVPESLRRRSIDYLGPELRTRP